MQRTGALAACDGPIGGIGGGERLVLEHGRHRVDARVDRRDPLEMRPDDVSRRHLPACDHRRQFARRRAPEFSHRHALLPGWPGVYESCRVIATANLTIAGPPVRRDSSR